VVAVCTLQFRGRGRRRGEVGVGGIVAIAFVIDDLSDGVEDAESGEARLEEG